MKGDKSFLVQGLGFAIDPEGKTLELESSMKSMAGDLGIWHE
jgi:hypothetical protein